MNNIVNIAQISLAVIHYSVAATLVGAAAFSTWTTKKSKLLTVAAVIAVLGLSSQAFAQAGSPCSDQIAYLRQRGPTNTAPQTIDGLTFYADLTRAEALDAEGYEDNCLMAVHRAAEDLAALKGALGG
jgi:hypothetical protein